MRIATKIGIGTAIIVACISAILALPYITGAPGVIVKVDADGEGLTNSREADLGTDPLDPDKDIIYGTAGNEVAVGNWGINVTPPTYTETLYKEYYDEYYVYEPRRGYRFALVKIKVINRGKEEDYPLFHGIKLVTTEGLRYKETYEAGHYLNHSIKSFKSPPTPLLKRFKTYASVLPRESGEGYFYFEVPVKAVPEDLLFKEYGGSEVRIKLRPKTPSPTPTTTPTPRATPSPTPTPTSPSFEAIFAIAVLIIAAYMLRRRK